MRMFVRDFILLPGLSEVSESKLVFCLKYPSTSACVGGFHSGIVRSPLSFHVLVVNVTLQMMDGQLGRNTDKRLPAS